MTLDDDDPEPRPPERPESGDCCGGGCERCVFDLYDQALERYQRDLLAWRQRNRDRRGELPSSSAADRQP